ncbi:hypothetical protein IW140_002894 [Coemansia sp. RSA 1813]|nr:hypothetical protein EV178_002814 [Coemansia sp. RSA 1646]KAJ1772001.1 hypothetical protein LPJ74_001893 [Coemansia sp. RSA 1843]KAJ2210512.1 hypothetical protein EV179_006191 [Coemansia sp. RSA 487]KAJ2569640.1 hypothetical protein IW140_002894 [Coemansia sp. RSA 1813]
MLVSNTLLRGVRFYLYVSAILLVVIELIVDALSLSSINDLSDSLPSGYRSGLSHVRGAAGYTMFVTLITLLLVPSIAFGGILANRGIAIAAILNRVLLEVSAVSALTLFWFVSGCVMANYADCGGRGMCSRFRAATAFAWLLFFNLLAEVAILVLILLKIRSSNGDIKTAYTYDVDDVSPTPVMAAAPMHSEQPYSPTARAEESYYESQPKVAMPTPH